MNDINKKQDRKIAQALLAALMVVMGSIAHADQGPVPVACEYQLAKDGKPIGELAVKRAAFSSGSALSAMRLDASMELDLTALNHNYHLVAASSVRLEGKHVACFDHRMDDSESRWRISGKRTEDGLWCRAVRFNPADGAAQPASAVSAVTADCPALLAEADLLVRNNKVSHLRRLQFASDSYDTSIHHLPVFLMAMTPKAYHTEVRVLDTTELEIQSWSFARQGKETLELAGRSFDCTLFGARSPDGKSTYWIAKDALGAFVVKEVSTTDTGSFALTLLQYDAGMPQPAVP